APSATMLHVLITRTSFFIATSSRRRRAVATPRGGSARAGELVVTISMRPTLAARGEAPRAPARASQRARVGHNQAARGARAQLPSSHICLVQNPPGGTQIPHEALQHVSPGAQVVFPQETPALGGGEALHSSWV